MKSYEPTESVRNGAELYKEILNKSAQPEEEAIQEESNEPEEELELEDESEELSEKEDSTEDEYEVEDEPQDNDETELFELKANGQVKQLTIDELKQFASQGIDYTKKTQELSERVRSEVERQVHEKTSKVEEARKGLLEATELVESLYNKPIVTREKLQELLDEGDLESYNRLKDQEDQRKELLGEIKRQKEDELKKQQEESNQKFQEYAKQQYELLVSKVPELAEKENLVKLTSYLQKVGYSSEEIQYAADARALEVAEKARKYDELMKEGVKPKKKTNAPNVIKKNRQVKPKKVDKNIEFAKNRFNQSKSMRDAAEYLKLLNKNK